MASMEQRSRGAEGRKRPLLLLPAPMPRSSSASLLLRSSAPLLLCSLWRPEWVSRGDHPVVVRLRRRGCGSTASWPRRTRLVSLPGGALDRGAPRHQERPLEQAAQFLAPGDVIEVSPPAPTPSEVLPQAIPLDVLYEDGHLIVINKPPASWSTRLPATPTHPGQRSARALPGSLRIGGVERPGIVHRSTRHLRCSRRGQDGPRPRSLSLSFAGARRTSVTSRSCTGRQTRPRAWWMRRSHATLRAQAHGCRPRRPPARTLWWVRERFAGAALVECRLVTGRTHQVASIWPTSGTRSSATPRTRQQWRAVEDSVTSAACRDFPRQASTPGSSRSHTPRPASDDVRGAAPRGHRMLLAVLRQS